MAEDEKDGEEEYKYPKTYNGDSDDESEYYGHFEVSNTQSFFTDTIIPITDMIMRCYSAEPSVSLLFSVLGKLVTR